METTLRKKLSIYFGEKTRQIITTGIVSFFILLFIYTATSKIFTFKEFSNGLHMVPVFGTFHSIVAVIIISLDIIIGFLLIVPATQKIGLYCTLVLLFIFTVYLIYMVSFVDILPCSCGGITSYLSWEDHIWCNSILILLAGFGILTNQ